MRSLLGNFRASLTEGGPWQTPTLSVPWRPYTGVGNYGGIRYRVNAVGQLEAVGLLETTAPITAPSSLFFLPAAYRPVKDRKFPANAVAVTSLPGNWDISAGSGEVVLTNFDGTHAIDFVPFVFVVPLTGGD